MCLFCDIARGERPAHVVFEDARTMAFLDIRPLFPGHSLLIPREHHETLTDLPDELVEPFFSAARRLAGAVEEAMEARGSFVAINNKISQSVPHMHAHIVPRRPKDGLKGFFWPRRRYEDEAEARQAAEAIRETLARREDQRA